MNAVQNTTAWTNRMINPKQVSDTNALVTATGVLEKLAGWRLEDGLRRPVSEPEISDRAILVGLMLLAGERAPLTTRSLADLFRWRLTPESQLLVGVQDSAGAVPAGSYSPDKWLSDTRRAFNTLVAVMDPFPQSTQQLTFAELQTVLDGHDAEREQLMSARLKGFTQAFLEMTLRQQPENLVSVSDRIDIAIGQYFVPSPITRGFSRRKLAARVVEELATAPAERQAEPIDAFAGWHVRIPSDGQTERNRHTDFAWGWTTHVAVRVDSTQTVDARFPRLVVSATLDMPGVGAAENALTLMRGALGPGLTPGIVDADFHYFANSSIERLHLPTSELGFTPSTDYRADRLGVDGGAFGAVFVEGKAYCQGMPQAFKDASKDHASGFLDDETFTARIAARVMFELVRIGKPTKSGRIRMICPFARNDRHASHPLHEDSTDPWGSCSGRAVPIEKADLLRSRQAFTYQSPKWLSFRQHAQASLNRVTEHIGNAIQGTGSSSTDNARGFAAAQVLNTVLLADYNLKAIAKFPNPDDLEEATRSDSVR